MRMRRLETGGEISKASFGRTMSLSSWSNFTSICGASSGKITRGDVVDLSGRVTPSGKTWG